MNTRIGIAACSFASAFVACMFTFGPKPPRPDALGDDTPEEPTPAAAARTERFDLADVATRSACATDAAAAGQCIAWSFLEHPTEAQLRDVAYARAGAERARAASAVLRTVERDACAGLAPLDRDMSPLDHPGDIVDVSTSTSEPLAVVFTLRPLPGLTEATLSTAARCYSARAEAVGLGSIAPDSSPLGVRGTTIRVSRSPNGLELTLQAPDEARFEELLARASKLPR